MTTYTKTQLIDLAIDKLGENPDWMVDSICVAVSTESNTVWGSGKFILISKKGQAFWEGIVPDRWQLVCTRGEFEQRVAERKASKPIDTETTSPTIEWWDYDKNEPLDFPPAGTECEYLEKGKWYKTNIIGMDSTDHCVYEVNDNDPDIREFPYNGWNCMLQFRPLSKLTERQQAGLKLWRSINYNDPMTDDEVLGYCRFEDYCLPWDLGLLK